ncbi:exodeoxyribonuclease V subunit alpha [Thermomonas paludicola]|uniref:exodeoxyribonuclease V subunit alpha n=1 Tax=Thermomonas paludicola TaxID=2884874 RepID=UPI0021148281|nr:exodeoxyribonuclease V subunit alpha [Thermomonas paludicola]
MSAHIAGERFGFAGQARANGCPDAWRDLDHAVWRWVIAHGGDAATAHAAAWASHAEGQGHSALPLSLPDAAGRPLLDQAQREALARSPLVANVAAGERAGGRPFVFDGDHLYLLRNHRAEVEVAQALRARRAAAHAPCRPLGDDDLRALFNGSWQDAEERQRAAVRQAVGRRLMVLTGGPGTGKTTTVLRMLLGLSREHHAATGRLPQLRIAAPTGKAAQRLAESLRQGAERLHHAGATPLGREWATHMDAVLAADAATVHRLLGSRGRHGGYAFHAGEPLPADIVVVDEASMLDLGLLRALLAALRDDAVLVLVGDADQLTSVGTGSVMMDVVQALEDDPRDDLVRLSHCFRADVALVPINEAVRAGDVAAFDIAIGAATVHAVPDVVTLRRRLSAWARNLQAALEAVAITTPVAVNDQRALAARLAVLHRQQLLCAQREGPFGATQAAETIAVRLRAWEALAPWSGGAWYPGRCVMVTRNDHAARLYNGDVGVCVLVDNGAGKPLLQVAFEPAPDASSAIRETTAAGLRLLDPTTLPPHEDAFALTVHKSQGSEYDRVAVLLPPDPASPLLVRQMLYTGLSRARKSVELWAVREVTEKALSTRLARHGRLAERIGSWTPSRPHSLQ